jgi:penicillin-binding protein 1A
MSKDQILEAYLNLVTLGNGATGIGAASQTYFSKPLTELTLAEVAYLAGLPKSPDDLSRNDAKGVERRNRVLDTMLGAGMISADQAASAKAQALGLRPDNPA